GLGRTRGADDGVPRVRRHRLREPAPGPRALPRAAGRLRPRVLRSEYAEPDRLRAHATHLGDPSRRPGGPDEWLRGAGAARGQRDRRRARALAQAGAARRVRSHLCLPLAERVASVADGLTRSASAARPHEVTPLETTRPRASAQLRSP